MGRTDRPAFSHLLLIVGAGLGEFWGDQKLPVVWGRLEGTGPYLFGVVPREDAVPMELLQDILQLLGGVWGDKGIALSRALLSPLRCQPTNRMVEMSLSAGYTMTGPLHFWEEATHALLSLSCFRGGQSAGQCTHVKLDGSSSSYL